VARVISSQHLLTDSVFNAYSVQGDCIGIDFNQPLQRCLRSSYRQEIAKA
jgi:hypothetical protein